MIKAFAEGGAEVIGSQDVEDIRRACEKVSAEGHALTTRSISLITIQVNSTIRKELRLWYTRRAATRFKENMAYLMMLPNETGTVTAPPRCMHSRCVVQPYQTTHVIHIAQKCAAISWMVTPAYQIKPTGTD